MATLSNAVRLVRQQGWSAFRYRLWAKWRGLDLTIAEISALGLSPDHSKPYMNGGGPPLAKVLARLPIGPNDAALDVGAGKGGAMITLARYFRRVDGLELAPELIPVAEQNFRRVGFRAGRIYHADACDFEGLNSYSHFFLFNPFPTSVVDTFMRRVVASLKRNPRTATVIYMVPTGDEAMRKLGFRLIARYTDDPHPVHIYCLTPQELGALAATDAVSHPSAGGL